MALAGLAACGDGGDDNDRYRRSTDGSPTPEVERMELRSAAFADGDAIPSEYTCESSDRSPPLSWSGAPAETAAFVILMDDPDAPRGTFDHWVLYNLPPAAELAAGVPTDARLAGGALQGRNGFGKTGYGGPCPPKGSEHRYSFRIYALDAPIYLEPGEKKGEVERAMRGHVLASGELVSRFAR